MRAAKYLFPLWAGVLLYVLLFVSFGSKGLSAYYQLEKEQKKQELNLENLKLINDELGDAMNSLLYDRDTLAVYAREQGYASENERFIRIVGLGVNNKSGTFPGNVLVALEPQFTQDKALIIIAFCAGICIFICMAVFDALKYFRGNP